MDDTVKIPGVEIVNSFLSVKRADFILVLSAVICSKEDRIRIALQEFQYSRDVIEEALAVSLKAIDRNDPGCANDDSLRRNIEQTIAAPLNLKEQPPISSLVEFSVLKEAQAELGVGK